MAWKCTSKFELSISHPRHVSWFSFLQFLSVNKWLRSTQMCIVIDFLHYPIFRAPNYHYGIHYPDNTNVYCIEIACCGVIYAFLWSSLTTTHWFTLRFSCLFANVTNKKQLLFEEFFLLQSIQFIIHSETNPLNYWDSWA